MTGKTLDVTSLLDQRNWAGFTEPLILTNHRQVSRKQRLPIAKVCLRLGLIQDALKIIEPLILDKDLYGAPSVEEMAEYSFVLFRAGSVNQSLFQLDKCDSTQFSKVHLYKACCYIEKWEFDTAKTELQLYMAMDLEPKDRVIGLLNLASVYISLELFESGLSILEEVSALLSQNSELKNFRGSWHELLAQVYFHQGKLDRSLDELSKADELIVCKRHASSLYVQKWFAIVKSFQTKDIGFVNNFADVARSYRHWESLRDVTFYKLRLQFSQTQFEHIYFGTPYMFFRNRLKRHFPQAHLPNHYVIGKKNEKYIDLRKGHTLNCEGAFYKNSNLSLVKALAGDFYRPQKVGELFSKIFPSEYYVASSSPNRVRQIILRCREAFERDDLPCLIHENQGFYRLRVQGHFGFVVDGAEQIVSKYENECAVVLQNPLVKERQSFRLKDAMAILNVSRATSQRILKWGSENGYFTRQGVGPASVYHPQKKQ